MKNGVWIFFMLLVFSCKLEGDKAKSNNETADITAQVSNEPKQVQHDHYYRIYKGKMKGVTSTPISTLYGECEFESKVGEKSRKLYLKGTDTANEIGNVVDTSFYILINKENKRQGLPKDKVYLLLKNNGLPIDIHAENEILKERKNFTIKGSLGCFPKFIIKNGNLDYYMVGEKRFIQLPMAYHVIGKDIIDTLEFRSFAISEANYNIINKKLNQNDQNDLREPNLQGGINLCDLNTLLLYLPNGDEWTTISGDNNPNPPCPDVKTPHSSHH